MQIFCSWCAGYMGEKEPLHLDVVTHSICPACGAEQLRQLGMERAAEGWRVVSLVAAPVVIPPVDDGELGDGDFADESRGLDAGREWEGV